MNNNFSTSMSLTEFNKSFTLQWNRLRHEDEPYMQIMAEVWLTLCKDVKTNPMSVFDRLTTMKARLGCSVLDIMLVSNSTGAPSRLTDFCLDQGLYESFKLLHWADLLAIDDLDPAFRGSAMFGLLQTYSILNGDSATQSFVTLAEVKLTAAMKIIPVNVKRAQYLDWVSLSAFNQGFKLHVLDEEQQQLQAAAETEKAKLERLTRKSTCHSKSKKSAPKSL